MLAHPILGTVNVSQPNTRIKTLKTVNYQPSLRMAMVLLTCEYLLYVGGMYLVFLPSSFDRGDVLRCVI